MYYSIFKQEILTTRAAILMERWNGKVAVVTGASRGIGESLVRNLAKRGMIVIALARNEPALTTLTITTKGKVHGMKCDIKSERNVLGVFKKIQEQFGGVDLLINNAACLNFASIIDGKSNAWKDILETNILGLSICTREALKTMRLRGDDGHIININAILGHTVSVGSIGMYPASKFAVTGLTETLRNELRNLGSNIKVTSISPEFVHTSLGVEAGTNFIPSLHIEGDERPSGYLSVQDVTDAVIATLSMRSNVEIRELMIQSCETLNLPKPAVCCEIME